MTISKSHSVALPATWLLAAFGKDRAYAGNFGYDDDPRASYRYDSNVQNHKRVRAGDIAVLRDRNEMLGIAVIQKIDSQPGKKLRRKCPICEGAVTSKAETKYRCRKGHTFPNPLTEEVDCTLFEAKLAKFVEAKNALPLQVLRAACPKYADQASIQQLEPEAIRWGLGEASPTAAKLLPIPDEDQFSPSADASYEDGNKAESETFIGASHTIRSILARRGQKRFRDSLIKRYGPRCLVSGCTQIQLVEAAHIAPYRFLADHSVTNGLLLRSDLHTLFDLYLLGINPHDFTASIHPEVTDPNYRAVHGSKLQLTDQTPGRQALVARWKRFIEKGGG